MLLLSSCLDANNVTISFLTLHRARGCTYSIIDGEENRIDWSSNLCNYTTDRRAWAPAIYVPTRQKLALLLIRMRDQENSDRSENAGDKFTLESVNAQNKFPELISLAKPIQGFVDQSQSDASCVTTERCNSSATRSRKKHRHFIQISFLYS